MILWSVFNETPKSEERLIFLKALIDEAHQQDPDTLLTLALLTHMDGKTGIFDDPLGQYLDVLGSNEYIGWYGGKADTAPLYLAESLQQAANHEQPGGGAESSPRRDHRPLHRRMQAEIYKQQLVISAGSDFSPAQRPGYHGLRSPVRLLPNIQDYSRSQGHDLEPGHKEGVFRATDFCAKMPQ